MSRSKNYTFTLNNYTEEEYDAIKSLHGARYIVIGKEVGDSGTPHLQGTIVWVNAKSFTATKNLLPRAHIEICRDLLASIEYCKKDGDFLEVGDCPRIRRTAEEVLEARIERNRRLLNEEVPLSELVSTGELSAFSVSTIQRSRLVLAQELLPYNHTDVRGIWYVGPPGTGKSRTARENYPAAYAKPQNKWFDGYTGQKSIILDDLDTDVLGHYLKIWGDRYSCSGEVKGGTVQLVHTAIIITSNFTIEELFSKPQMSQAIKRRFHVTHFRTL